MRHALASLSLLALLAGCGDDTPVASPIATARPAITTAQPAYDYLPKLGLDVSEIVVDGGWGPTDIGEHVEDTAHPRPADALAQLARDRLVATGGSGRALVTITDASLLRVPGQLIGSFTLQVTLDPGTGEPAPPVVASVSGTRTLASDDSEAATADALVRQLMDAMNVELEYQVRHQLKDHLGGPTAPVAAPVQSEDLAPPSDGTAPATPASRPPEPVP